MAKRYRVQSAEDFKQFANFKEKLDFNVDGIVDIVHRYFLSIGTKCGGCGTEHQDGCIVLLACGGHGNLGHICGKKVESFREAFDRFTDKRLRPALVAYVDDGINHLRPLLKDFKTLNAAAERLELRKSNFDKKMPKLVLELRRRAIANNARLTTSRKLSDEEVEERLAANPFQNRERLQHEEVHAGDIEGLKIFEIAVDRMSSKLLGEVDRFLWVVPGELSNRDLIEWEQWIPTVEETVKATRSLLSQGDNFFTRKNLNRLDVLALPSREREALKELNITDLDRREVAPPPAKSAVVKTAKKLHRKARRALAFSPKMKTS